MGSIAWQPARQCVVGHCPSGCGTIDSSPTGTGVFICHPVEWRCQRIHAHASCVSVGGDGVATKQLCKLEKEEQDVVLSSYSSKFEKCQFVKQYETEEGGSEEKDSILNTKRFVIFCLCPNQACSSCNYNYLQ